jgi:mycoredoxin
MPEQICVYGTSWCPDTARSRRCLQRLGVAYLWRDIERDKEACAFVERVNKGKRSVPTITLPDGAILVEPTDSELEKRLSKK